MNCEWWWSGLMFVGGFAIGQLFLMTSLAMVAGGDPERDEHERSGI